MRIAVCASGPAEGEQLCRWIAQYCALYGRTPEILPFPTADTFFASYAAHPFGLVFMALGGPEGFLRARELRDRDRDCRIVFVGDTEEFAVRGVRLHFTDYIVEPADFKKVARAMKLAGV